MKIRITSNGIFGLPASDENPSGEYPIGHEIDLGKNEPPAGWAGRYQEIGGKAGKDAVMVTNPIDDSAERGTESEDQSDQPRRPRPASN